MDRILKFYWNFATHFEMILFVFMKDFLFVSHVSVKNTTCRINYLPSLFITSIQINMHLLKQLSFRMHEHTLVHDSFPFMRDCKVNRIVIVFEVRYFQGALALHKGRQEFCFGRCQPLVIHNIE